MNLWQLTRNPLLALTFGCGLLVLGKSVLSPPSAQSKAYTVTLPENVPLGGWQFQNSQPLTDPIGKTYQYKRGTEQLAIELRYVTHPHANEKLFREYVPTLANPTSPSPTQTPVIRQQNGIGFYSLSVKDGRAYLRSCINPRGEGAITYEQFIRNRYTADLQPSRFLPVLTGQEPLRDHRCLWAYLSVPVKDSSPETAYQTLEKLWSPWYQWWHTRFPQL